MEKFDLEGDAQVLVQAINHKETYLSWFGELIEDVKV